MQVALRKCGMGRNQYKAKRLEHPELYVVLKNDLSSNLALRRELDDPETIKALGLNRWLSDFDHAIHIGECEAAL